VAGLGIEAEEQPAEEGIDGHGRGDSSVARRGAATVL
jgi:hypothetical protein